MIDPKGEWLKFKEENTEESFDTHRRAFNKIFSEWSTEKQGPPPVWWPDSQFLHQTNVWKILSEKGFIKYSEFYDWSIKQRENFWSLTIEKLGIRFIKKSSQILDLSAGAHQPVWLKGAALNIADSCFKKKSDDKAIVFQKEGGTIQSISYGQLLALTNRIANGLVALGLKKGDAVAIDMPMNAESVAIYLGIVKCGLAVVSIADSFAPDEISTRLRISNAKAIFTQDVIIRGGKTLPMYSKVAAAKSPLAIVLSAEDAMSVELRPGDIDFRKFLSSNTEFESVVCDPYDTINILFSSGTTGEPKAIPWTHLTPIKSAADGFYHHDIQSRDIVAWPTNLGWMMGPWLIFATLINNACIALYEGAPHSREFGKFIEEAQISILGLVPSIVKAWRQSKCMEGLDWSSLKAFSSTGECSNSDDYFYLMYLGGYIPIVEYCGGTEIGGGYLSQTLVQAASPSTFSTPTLGLSFYVLNEDFKATREGELFLVPPSIGLSQRLLNRDHDEVYFKDVPVGPKGEILRRHGDEVEVLPNGYFRAHGRADDTMNLGGIKVSSVEIERSLNSHPAILETAAIAVNPRGGGPSLLVVFAVLNQGAGSSSQLKMELQKELSSKLNPLFKIHDVVVVESLPRTASNKVMRRVLRDSYRQG